MPRVPKPYRGRRAVEQGYKGYYAYRESNDTRTSLAEKKRRYKSLYRKSQSRIPTASKKTITRRGTNQPKNIPVRAKMILRERYATRAKLIKTRRGGMKPQGR